MDTNEKLDEALKSLYRMEPKVDSIHEGQKAMDIRIRVVETQGTEHKIIIARALEDLDGLGRKVRSYPPTAAARAESRGGKWMAFMEFLEVLPGYAKFIIPWAMAAGAIVVAAWRRRP